MMLYCAALLLFALHLTAASSGHTSDVPVVAVPEGSDAVLRCSPNPVQNLVLRLFDWKMGEEPDNNKDVFMYDEGEYDRNGHSSQHDQFKGRVSHFPDQLIYGNASITIRNTKIEDTGIYTCRFPKLRYQTSKVKLVVDPIFRDRSGKTPGVAHEPYVSICGVSESGVLLKCEAKGVFPKPDVLWLDSHGDVLPAEVLEVSREQGGLFDVTLQTTVNSTNTNCFRCVVKQKDFHHQIERNLTVPGKLFEKTSGDVNIGWMLGAMLLGVFIGAILLAVCQAFLVATKRITVSLNKGHRPAENPEDQKLKEKPKDHL